MSGKEYRKLITSRIFVTALMILVQTGWFILFFLKLTRHSAIISGFFTLLGVAFVLYIIKKDGTPEFKIGWLLIITTLPLFGSLMYLFFGDKKPSRKLRAKIEHQHEIWKKYLIQAPEVMDEIVGKNQRLSGSFRYLSEKDGYPVWKNTKTEYFPVGEKMYGAMLEELKKAEHFIFLEYFIIHEGEMWNTIHGILVEKAKQGVDVRLIYDDMGCVVLLPPGYAQALEREGIKCMAFNPVVPFLSMVMNNRDHRKILVIDGHTAFNGGINISDEYINKQSKFGHWKDTGVKVTGDAAWNFTVMFLEMWNAFRTSKEEQDDFRPKRYFEGEFESDGYVQPFSDSPLDDETAGENIYLDILNQAKDYVYIFTPYLILNSELRSALCLAAKRGVDVRMVTPGIPDKKIVYRLTRANYKSLLKAGVKIYEYTPGFIHAKSYVSDDEYAVVGTINMDYRSLFLHFECGTFMYQSKAVMDLKQDSLETIEKSRKIVMEDCKTSALGSLFDAVLLLVAPLF